MHTSLEELRLKLNEAAQSIEIGGHYMHYKTPTTTYEVKELVINEADEQLLVLYFPVVSPETVFARPLTSWLEEVGPGVRRFRTLQ